MIIQELEAAQEAGDAATDLDPADTASMIITVMDGLQIQWLYDAEAVDIPKRVGSLINALTGTGARGER